MDTSRFQVRPDGDGFWFIGEPVKRRFLFWTWTEWVNVTFWPGTETEIYWATKEEAEVNLAARR